MTAAHTYRTREEWLRARRLGSSDVAAVLGLSPYRTAWDVWERLTVGVVDEASSADAARGTLLEPRVLAEYARATGRTVTRPPPHTLYTRDGWASASPDGLAADRVVEAKTDRDRTRWGEPAVIERWTPDAAELVRRDYYLQVAHQMWVLDADRADLAVLLPGDDPFLPELRVYQIHRDPDVEAALVETLSGWWARHVVGGEPPPLDGSRAASRYLAVREREGARPATLPEIALAARYAVAARERDRWDDERRLAGQLLVEAAGSAARLDLPRGRVSLVRTAGRLHLDEAALLAARPDLAPVLDQYRRRTAPTVTPRISGLETS